MTVPGFLGLLGVLLYLGSYAGLQFGLLRGSSYTYTLLNLAAASCVLASLTDEFNLSSALIQISWIVISIVGLTRLWRASRLQFSAQERFVLDRLAPSLGNDRARHLLDNGEWRNTGVGTRVLREGQPVESLSLLVSGALDVGKGGNTIARLGPGALVGEMSYLAGGPATADVSASAPSRLFCIRTGDLRAMMRKDETLAAALEMSVAAALRAKLGDASEALAGRKA